MKIMIAGGTGFIGGELVAQLQSLGTRCPEMGFLDEVQ